MRYASLPPSSFSLKMSGACLCQYDLGERKNLISLRSAQHNSQQHQLGKHSDFKCVAESLTVDTIELWLVLLGDLQKRQEGEKGSRLGICPHYIPGGRCSGFAFANDTAPRAGGTVDSNFQEKKK